MSVRRPLGFFLLACFLLITARPAPIAATPADILKQVLGTSEKNSPSDQPADKASTDKKSPPVTVSENAGRSLHKEATDVRQQLTSGARNLFVHEPLGWDTDTLKYVYRLILVSPALIPQLINEVLKQSQVLGVAGSIIMLIFIIALVYSLMGRRHVLNMAEELAKPLTDRLPKQIYPYILLALRSLTAALIPVILYWLFLLIRGFIEYNAPWFLLIGQLLKLWFVAALILSLINGAESLQIIRPRSDAGKKVFTRLRIVVLFILFCIGILWAAETFALRVDLMALLRFIISISIVIVLFLFFLNKEGILSFLPDLPYEGYQKFIRGLARFYYPVIGLTFLTGILWSIGFKHFSMVVWRKTWAIAAVYVAASVIYHIVINRVQAWSEQLDSDNDDARLFISSLKSLILYLAVIITVLIMTELLGVLGPIRQLLSFQLLRVGESTLTPWILVKAILFVVVFVYLSKMVRYYLNYKVYPSLGVEPGPAYAINTFLHYFLLIASVLISLQIVGFDLRALLVFAGAVGIGLGFALQSMASNMISGFAIIFGGQIRKGDWVEVEGSVGVVTDIYIRATKVRTRDNIEYIIPNNTLMSSTIINYSLSSPYIRIKLPFGVSYSADPKVVSNIALETAENESSVMVYRKPEIRFTGYGDSSIDFELLLWVDIRKTARKLVRSRMYFALFDAFKAAEIEIPFPQRDLNIRTGIPWDRFTGQMQSPEAKAPPDFPDRHEMPDQSDESDLEELAEAVKSGKRIYETGLGPAMEEDEKGEKPEKSASRELHQMPDQSNHSDLEQVAEEVKKAPKSYTAAEEEFGGPKREK